MDVLSPQDINEAWLCQRVIDLLDDGRNEEALALSAEHGYDFDLATAFIWAADLLGHDLVLIRSLKSKNLIRR